MFQVSKVNISNDNKWHGSAAVSLEDDVARKIREC